MRLNNKPINYKVQKAATYFAKDQQKAAEIKMDLGILAIDDALELPTITGRFAEIVALFPENLAGVHCDEAITYQMLDQQSDRLAGFLIEKGVTPSMSVGIMGEYSNQTLIALLAILKTGAHYLYLDNRQSSSYLQNMADTTQLHFVIFLSPQAIIPELKEVDWIFVDEAKNRSVSELNLPKLSGDTLAYINFSSGTTGVPKAIGCRHAGVIRLCLHQNFIEWGPSVRFLVNAPLSFDAATLEIWGPLLNGGTCIIHSGEPISPEAIIQNQKRFGLNAIWLSSALFNLITDLNPNCFKGMKRVIAGGDVLSVSHVRRAMTAAPDTCFINGYGPTENTTFTTCHIIDAKDLEASAIPIGIPIRGTGVLICDEQLNPVPDGQVGELVAFGEGLAQGYLQDQNLTAEKFRIIPVNGIGTRVYRTGDLAKREGGTFHFLGRKDRETKINGFRIDLSGVEWQIRKHSYVQDCCAFIFERSGTKSLIVAVVSNQNNFDYWIQEAFKPLASFQQPHGCFQVPSIPINANGKVDVRKLQEIWFAGQTESLGLQNFDLLETKIEALWKKTLGVALQSKTKDFFQAGGNSLLAVHFLTDSALAELIPFPLKLDEFYQNRTFESFVRLIRNKMQSAGRLLQSSFELNPYQRSLVLNEMIYENSDTNTLLYLLKENTLTDEGSFSSFLENLGASHPLLTAQVKMLGDEFHFELAEKQKLTVISDIKQYETEMEFINSHLSYPLSVFKGGLALGIKTTIKNKVRYALLIHHIAVDAQFIARIFEPSERETAFVQENKSLNDWIQKCTAQSVEFWKQKGIEWKEKNLLSIEQLELSPETQVLRWKVSQYSSLAWCCAALEKALKSQWPGHSFLALSTFNQAPLRNKKISGYCVNLAPLLISIEEPHGTLAQKINEELGSIISFSSLPVESILEATNLSKNFFPILINIVPRPDYRVLGTSEYKTRRPLTLTVFQDKIGGEEEWVMTSMLSSSMHQKISSALMNLSQGANL